MGKKKKLFDILPLEEIKVILGKKDREITNLAIDSRFCESGCLFLAFRGSVVDGHQFINSAIEKGANVIVCENLPDQTFPHVTYVQVANARKAAGFIANKYYGSISDRVIMVGVTGTNGKTTIATLLYNLFSSLGYTCGLISTVENIINGKVVPATHTTPDVIQLHKLLQTMEEAGCTHVFMEVSSHAVDQDRIGGLHFKVAIFSNISQDHLDYHKTMDRYIKAKKTFFDHLNKESYALINIDDKRGRVMVQNTLARIKTYSLRTMADYKGNIIDNNIIGLMMKINGQEAYFKLIGDFNAYNILAVYGTALILGQPIQQVLTILSGIQGPAGRFEQIIDPISQKCGIVDYAHTPDAVENVLLTIKAVKKPASKIFTVVGCGGDRDKTKRPIMARIAVDNSDVLILTSDNPRTEDPEKILDDMQAGISNELAHRCLRITDRKSAIQTAVMMAGNGDVVLVAGKGHETYQEIMGVKTPFDDKKLLSEFLLSSKG
ncbi:MAG: UDP-N-acetylmuramoyl-L-alanyl-D-glutamate--2,6-diaminopimelate ligase [Saprospiraceae bacterium]